MKIEEIKDYLTLKKDNIKTAGKTATAAALIAGMLATGTGCLNPIDPNITPYPVPRPTPTSTPRVSIDEKAAKQLHSDINKFLKFTMDFHYVDYIELLFISGKFDVDENGDLSRIKDSDFGFDNYYLFNFNVTVNNKDNNTSIIGNSAVEISPEMLEKLEETFMIEGKDFYIDSSSLKELSMNEADCVYDLLDEMYNSYEIVGNALQSYEK